MGLVLSLRAVRDEHVGRDGRDDGNVEVGWRCGRAEMWRRAVMARYARASSMVYLMCWSRGKGMF